MSSKPPYKNKNNVWLTQVLFWEKWQFLDPVKKAVIDPPFSLYDNKPGRVNCRTTFVDLGDPTGYRWAMRYLGDYAHWQTLLKSDWFQEALSVWQNELKQKVRADALETIRAISKSENPAQALPAAKYLAGFEWEKGSRGRPSKQEVAGELKKQAQLLEAEDDDWQRIKVVK